jgi:hypothetical protein
MKKTGFQAVEKNSEVKVLAIWLAAWPVACYNGKNFILGNLFDAEAFFRSVMNYSQFGGVIALIGMVLLLITNLNRRAARQRKIWTRTDVIIQKWGGLSAYALIALGLLFLLRR